MAEMTSHVFVCPYVLAGRVFCKKGCDADGETWDDCKLDSSMPITDNQLHSSLICPFAIFSCYYHNICLFNHL